MRFHNSEAALDLVKLVIGSGQAFVRHSVIVLTVGCVFINEGSVPGKTAFSFECLFINSFNSRLCFSRFQYQNDKAEALSPRQF